MVTDGEKDVRTLISRAIEVGLVKPDGHVILGLPGSSGRSAKTMARGLRAVLGGRPPISALTRYSDEELAALPDVGEDTVKRIRDGLISALLVAEHGEDEEAVRWEVLGPRRTTPLVGPLTNVTTPCRDGRHYRCTGKLATQKIRHGKRYTRCRCPFCAQTGEENHTGTFRTRALKK